MRTGTTVERVPARCATGFDVVTDDGRWRADAVVVAAGACSEPRVPPLAAELPPDIAQLTAPAVPQPGTARRRRGARRRGLGVGRADRRRAPARAGREVTLAVGEHVRLPRTYRGRDIHWWMDAIGQLDERYDEVDDIDRARRLPSLQLVGTPERRTLDLNALAAQAACGSSAS